MADTSKFTWAEYPGATGYNVYRAPEADPLAFVLTETNIPVSVLEIDCEYVKVTAITPSGETPLDCTPVHFCFVPPPPPLTCVTYFLDNPVGSGIDVVWDDYPTATGYNVYIAEEADPDTYVLAHANVPNAPITIDCQYAIVTALTPQGETPQCAPVHFCQVEGPFAYYKLDDSTPFSTLIDEISAYDLALSSGTGASVSGKIGTAIQLNGGGSREWSIFPSDGHFDLAEFTIRFWIYRDDSSKSGSQTFIFNDSWTIALRPDFWDFGLGYIGYTVDTNPGTISDVPNDPLTEGGWSHVVLWYQAGVGCGLRINNGSDHLMASTDPLTVHTNLALRLHGWSRIPGQSAIDEIAIWNRVLTGAEITADYNGGAGVTYP